MLIHEAEEIIDVVRRIRGIPAKAMKKLISSISEYAYGNRSSYSGFSIGDANGTMDSLDSVANNNPHPLSHEEAHAALDLLDDWYDSSDGQTWDDVSSASSEIIERRGEVVK